MLLGGLVYVFAAEYFVLEKIAAAAWTSPSYSWSGNYISDLGVTSCSVDLCSPRHAWMNAAFVTLGAVISVGSWLLRHELFAGRIGGLGLALMLLSGMGDVLLGTFPGTLEATGGGTDSLHTLGATLAIIGGNAGVLVCGLTARPTRPWLAGYCIVSGLVGLGALALFAIGVDRGLGIGGIERVAANPVVIAMIVLGASSLIRPQSARLRGSAG